MKNRRFVLVVVLALVMGLLFTGVAVGDTGSKTLKAVYKNIKIIVDGKTATGDEEPFIVGDRVYVPFRMIGEALGVDVDWDAETSSVKVAGGGSSADASLLGTLQMQLLQKQKEIDELKAEVAKLQEGKKVQDSDFRDLKRDLSWDHDYLRDVYFDDFSLSGSKDKVKLDIDVDLYDYDREWRKLRDRDIEDYVEDVVKDVQAELGRDCYVDGRIIDIDSRDTLVTFSKDGRSRMSVSFRDRKYRSGGYGYVEDVERDLKGEYFEIGKIDFKVTSIEYTSRDVIDVTIDAVSRNVKSDWNDLSSSKKNSDMRSICIDIADIFIDEADADPREVRLEVQDYYEDYLGSYTYKK
ncbi:MAG: copper amine oxidase N-terminal domain-containing protein [Clostridia bacterium]|nr:copper amine oxidase N-terminal domain-containing protein [Clostridia bacterium]